VAVSAVQASTPDQPSPPTEVVSAVKAVKSRREKFEPLLSDPKLEKFKDDIFAFWKAKKGAKNERAWSILLTELGKIQSKYGDAVMLDQLQLGTQAGTWNSISLNRYEQFKPKSHTAAEPQYKHPAYRDAADVLAESDRIAQQNLEHLRRKQEESEPATGPLADLF
jgi:hypothetical protein